MKVTRRDSTEMKRRETHFVYLLVLEERLEEFEIRDVLILVLRVHLHPYHRHVAWAQGISVSVPAKLTQGRWK
jgi:hypothetical protein